VATGEGRKIRKIWQVHIRQARLFFVLSIILALAIGGFLLAFSFQCFETATYHEKEYYQLKNQNSSMPTVGLTNEETETMQYHHEEFTSNNDLGTMWLAITLLPIISVVFAIGAFISVGQMEFGVAKILGVLCLLSSMNIFALPAFIYVIKANRAWDDEVVVTPGQMIKITIVDQEKKDEDTLGEENL
jgi:hypothetical protein